MIDSCARKLLLLQEENGVKEVRYSQGKLEEAPTVVQKVDHELAQ